MPELIDSFVKLLLHFDGVDTATADIDYSGQNHILTFAGNAQLDTAQKKFGLSSLLLDGTDDYVWSADHADWDFGTGAFTVDIQVYFTSTSGTRVIMAHGGIGHIVDIYGWTLFIFGGNLYWGTKDPAAVTHIVRSWTPSTSTWYHIEVSRDSSDNLRMFIDGTQIGATEANYTKNINVGASQLRIGINHEGGKDFAGSIDEPRISKGIARHTSNFTPVPYAYQKIARIINQ